jgi:DNA polymerase III sliding clamp (beta) subunit (PCNA family)
MTMKLYSKKQLQVVKGCSPDETRPALNGVLADKNKLVATDGHKMFIVEDKAIDSDKDWPVNGVDWQASNKPFIIPSSAINKAIKNIPKSKDTGGNPILEKVAIGETPENTITLQTTDLDTTDNIKTKKVDGKFPNYERVIPTLGEVGGYDKKVGLNAHYMIEALKLMINFADDKSKMVTFHMKDENHSIVLTCENEETKTTCVVMPMRL